VSVKNYLLSDLSKGQIESISTKITIEDVNAFAALSGDISPVHLSDDFAVKKALPGRIAHGLLIGARVSSLIGNSLPGAFGILQSFDIEFRSPLVPPQEIQIQGEVTNISEGTGQVSLSIIVTASGKLIAKCKAKTIVSLGTQTANI